MSKVFFKIIIPNFNNEKYIERCLTSIQQQTFTDYKVIVIDDMSTDSSFDIAKKFAQNDPQHFECVSAGKKSYQGICRNIGIEYPLESEYTWFIDADDYVLHQNVLALYKKLVEQHPDIEMFAFDYEEDRNGQFIYKTSPSIIPEINRGYFCINGIFAPWARIYKTSSIKDLRYRSVLFEDMLFFIEYLDRGPKIAELHNAFYRYRINPEGDTLKYRRRDPVYVKRYQEMLQCLNELRQNCRLKQLSTCIKNRLIFDGFKI